MSGLEETRKLVDAGELEFFLCSFVEMGGMPKAKLVPAKCIDDMAAGSAGFAGFAAGNMGQGPHDTDMIAIPDFSSVIQLPWRSNLAWVASNIEVDEKPWPYCPRTILQNNLEQARQKGYVLKVGVEPEFMLLRRNEDGGYAPFDPLDRLDKPCYDLTALNRSLDLMTTLVRYLDQLGWGPYANDHEDANCQFEINWTYSDALRTADRHTFYRWMVKALAEERGLTATFMPKPFSNLTGNGAHFHISLWDAETDENLFLDESDENGLSQLAYHFIGGDQEARPGHDCGDRSHGQLLQAVDPGGSPLGSDLGSRVRHLRSQQPDADDPDPGCGTNREPDRGRRREPLPGRVRHSGRRSGRHRERAAGRHPERPQPV